MNTHLLVRISRLASLLMLLVAVALIAAIITMHFAIHGAEVQVPAFKGMTVDDARSEAAGLGLILDVDNRYFSGDLAAGHILSQSPAAGTVVRREWHVRVAESLGPQKVNVPNTIGSNERAASLELRRAGLEVGLVAHLPYASASEGKVLAQDPPPNALGIAQPNVSLLIATPGDGSPDGFVMPDFTGWTLSSAQAAFANVAIKMAPPSYVNTLVGPVGSGNAPFKPPTQTGTVLTQSPAAGSRVDQNSVAKFSVAR